MRKLRIYLFVWFIFGHIFALNVSANEPTGQNINSQKNVMCEIKIVIFEHDKEKRVFRYYFNNAENRKWKYLNGHAKPYKSKEDGEVNYIDIGTKIYVNHRIKDDLNILQSKVEIVYVDSYLNEDIPIVNTIEYDGTSVHNNNAFQNVFNGELSIENQRVEIFIKVN